MPCSALTRIIGENIGSKNGVSQQNEESGWDIADTLLGLLHRDCSGWEERNERDSRYAAFYAVACSWGLIWQATGLGNCLLDLHKQDCAYMTGQIWWEDGAYFFLAWPLHLLFLLGLTRASDSCRSPLLGLLGVSSFQDYFPGLAWHSFHLALTTTWFVVLT